MGRATVLLVGSPNVGKSVLFQSLTGSYATVSNYPGTTTEVSRGVGRVNGKSVFVIDTPGLYGIPALTGDERVTVDCLLSPPEHTVVVHVVSAVELERMLTLSLWVSKLGLPLVVVVNMMDEAGRAGIDIDLDLLTEELDCPVVGCIATEGHGVDDVKAAIVRVMEMSVDRSDVAADIIADEGEARLVTERLSVTAAALADAAISGTERAVSNPDRFLLHPVWGFLFAAAVFYLTCILFVGYVCAGMIVDTLDSYYASYLHPHLLSAVETIPLRSIQRLLAGEFGLLALAFRYAVVIILPIVTGFFFAFALLEDSGYLPRLSVLSDRLLRPIGIGGSTAMPLVLGLGCTTMATVFTRILPSDRDRIITVFLLALAVPCSAQLGVITGLLAQYPAALAIWGGVIGFTAIVCGRICAAIVGGSSPPLIVELPPLRLPRAINVCRKVVTRVKWYALEVLPLFIIVCSIVWLLAEVGLLTIIEGGLATIASWARLPAEVAPALLLGFFRRDYGAAGLFALRHQLTLAELTVASVMLTLLFPCIAQFVVMIREMGWKAGVLMALCVFSVALSVSALLGWLVIGW